MELGLDCASNRVRRDFAVTLQLLLMITKNVFAVLSESLLLIIPQPSHILPLAFLIVVRILTYKETRRKVVGLEMQRR